MTTIPTEERCYFRLEDEEETHLEEEKEQLAEAVVFSVGEALK